MKGNLCGEMARESGQVEKEDDLAALGSALRADGATGNRF